MPSAASLARQSAIFTAGKLGENKDQLLSELGKGYDTSKGFFDQGGSLYGGMAQQGLAGLNRYQALAGGGGAANAALQETAGYQFALDQGLNALNRQRAAGGMLNSGNAGADAMRFAQGLASQTLQQERQAQIPLMNLYSQGTVGQAQNYGNLARLSDDYYGSRAGVIDDANKGVIEAGRQAYSATAQGKQQQLNNWLGAANSAVGLLGSLAGGGFKMPKFGG